MDRRSIPTNKTKHEFKDLQAGKTYEFQVYFKHHMSSTANYFVSMLIIITVIGLLVFFFFLLSFTNAQSTELTGAQLIKSNGYEFL